MSTETKGAGTDRPRAAPPGRDLKDVPFPGRRSFLGMLLGIGAAGMGALLSVHLVRYALHPLMSQPTETAWSDLGDAAGFDSVTAPVKRIVRIEQRDGWRRVVTEKPVYIVKSADGRARVFSTVCPHLGCTVAWNEERQRFISPCHNGMFAPDGSLVSGPPRRGMDELDSKVEGGRLLIRYQFFRPLLATKEVIA